MRVLVWLAVALVMAGRAMAAPEPPPPGDYPGTQYIDRSGCVFVKQGADWVPRLDKTGAAICGFPPSQPAENAAAPPSPEALLTDILAEGLRSGDLAALPPAAPLNPVAADPAQAELDRALALQIDLDERIRSTVTGRAPDGLCERLGYRPSAEARPIIGGDVTQGLCPGMAAPLAGPLIVAATDAGPGKTAAPVGAADKPQPRAPTARTGTRRDTPAPQTSSVVARRAAPAPPPAAIAGVEMIPAGARYVQIGFYADEANALSALRRLSSMGYRTAQIHERRNDRPGKAILAGPFADRQALVTALARLRAQGYPRAVAR